MQTAGADSLMGETEGGLDVSLFGPRWWAMCSSLQQKERESKAQVLTPAAQSTYPLKTTIQQFQMLFEQEKSKEGQRDFSPAAKNETLIARTLYPLLSLLWVLSYQHETHHIIMNKIRQSSVATWASHRNPMFVRLEKGKHWVSPRSNLALSGAQCDSIRSPI